MNNVKYNILGYETFCIGGYTLLLKDEYGLLKDKNGVCNGLNSVINVLFNNIVNTPWLALYKKYRIRVFEFGDENLLEIEVGCLHDRKVDRIRKLMYRNDILICEYFKILNNGILLYTNNRKLHLINSKTNQVYEYKWITNLDVVYYTNEYIIITGYVNFDTCIDIIFMDELTRVYSLEELVDDEITGHEIEDYVKVPLEIYGNKMLFGENIQLQLSLMLDLKRRKFCVKDSNLDLGTPYKGVNAVKHNEPICSKVYEL